jgi:hypothetical protein
LLALVAQAAKEDKAALEQITALEQSRILAVADLPGIPPFLARLETAWRQAIDEYSKLAASLQHRVTSTTTLALTPAQKAMLLGAGLPASPILAALRRQSSKSATDDAKECGWFQDLGDPANANSARLLLMTLLAPIAEEETRQTRAELAARQQEREKQASWSRSRIALVVLLSGYGLLLGPLMALMRSIIDIDPILSWSFSAAFDGLWNGKGNTPVAAPIVCLIIFVIVIFALGVIIVKRINDTNQRLN